ncbi:hypothetical protein BS50DRAFT_149930 [Corynespora cassiicola Philippines]|uniref:Secreted protein n=1 Tax=Corynespora cassiicola Philippines TaxID=1448308 RepID=A0A2T2N834_CORCC|nr:hypothetical protein BS50DRAFT_149930 [Corynespora cassiicola Philippines]
MPSRFSAQPSRLLTYLLLLHQLDPLLLLAYLPVCPCSRTTQNPAAVPPSSIEQASRRANPPLPFPLLGLDPKPKTPKPLARRAPTPPMQCTIDLHKYS